MLSCGSQRRAPDTGSSTQVPPTQPARLESPVSKIQAPLQFYFLITNPGNPSPTTHASNTVQLQGGAPVGSGVGSLALCISWLVAALRGFF